MELASVEEHFPARLCMVILLAMNNGTDIDLNCYMEARPSTAENALISHFANLGSLLKSSRYNSQFRKCRRRRVERSLQLRHYSPRSVSGVESVHYRLINYTNRRVVGSRSPYPVKGSWILQPIRSTIFCRILLQSAQIHS